MIKIVDSGRPLAESDLQRLEQNLDVGLPRPYRAFLIAHNGGIPKPSEEVADYRIVITSCRGIPGKKAKPTIYELFGDNPPPPVIPSLTQFLGNDEGPEDSITVGRTVGRKHVRMVVQGDAVGSVVLFDLARFAARSGEVDVAEFVTPLASSFDALIERSAPELTASGPVVTDKELDRCQESIFRKTDMRIRFPEPFGAFYRKTNGGLVTRGNVMRWTVDGQDHVDMLAVLYLLEGRGPRRGPQDLLAQAKLYAGRVPPDTLPIGEQDGDLFLVGTKGENLGKVFFWAHDGESDVPSYDNVTPVADTFAEFIDGLEAVEVK